MSSLKNNTTMKPLINKYMNKQQAALEILCALIAHNKGTATNHLIVKAVELANQLQEELDKQLMGNYFNTDNND